jgi:AcrR family transcriptional regulator
MYVAQGNFLVTFVTFMSQTRDAGKTRETIIRTCTETFFRNGYRGITMNELAELAGVSKKTIYVYFPTKISLLEAVLELKLKSVYETLDATREAHKENTMACFMSVMERWQKELSIIQPVFWRDIQHDAAIFLKITTERRRRIIHGIFGRIIRDGVAAGEFRNDLNPELVADIIIASAEGIIRSGKCDEYKITPKLLLLTLVKLVIEGSLTESGRKKWSLTTSPAKKTINA